MKDYTYLQIAHTVSKESKCVSYKVGAILVKDGRVIITAYNGTPSGFINCCDQFKNTSYAKGTPTSEDRHMHHEWSNKFEVHAEINAMAFAAKHGISTSSATLYCTHRPCHNCLKSVIPAGIIKVVYMNEYDKDLWTEETYDLIRSTKMIVERFGQEGKIEVSASNISIEPRLGYWESMVQSCPTR